MVFVFIPTVILMFYIFLYPFRDLFSLNDLALFSFRDVIFIIIFHSFSNYTWFFLLYLWSVVAYCSNTILNKVTIHKVIVMLLLHLNTCVVS